MRRIIAVSLVVIFTGLVSGCNKPDIIVADSAGKPVEGVVVTGQCLFCSGQATTTDKDGYASIPLAEKETLWISVTKPGYLPLANIDVNQQKPIRIVLTALKNAD
jgi:hypothetical protein